MLLRTFLKRVKYGNSLFVCSQRPFASLRKRSERPESWQLYEPPPTNVDIYPNHATLMLAVDALDFVPLEKFTSFAHKKARQFGFQVTDSYALPPTKILMVTGESSKKKVISEITLSTYHRVLLLDRVPSVRLQLYLDLMMTHAPVGFKITVRKFTEEDEKLRYIPDEILESRKAELKSLDDPKVRKLLGWE